MEGVELELERRSKFLNNLIQQKKKAKEQQDQKDEFNVRVRASDMPLSVQNRAFSLSRELLDATPGKADNKRLALALKKVTSFTSKIASFIRITQGVYYCGVSVDTESSSVLVSSRILSVNCGVVFSTLLDFINTRQHFKTKPKIILTSSIL